MLAVFGRLTGLAMIRTIRGLLSAALGLGVAVLQASVGK